MPTSPSYCYAHHPITRRIILIHRGAPGHATVDFCDKTADELNAKLSPPVTEAQAKDMLIRSMVGWPRYG